jgi:hypothetical protein
MNEPGTAASGDAVWLAVAVLAFLAIAVVLCFGHKGRRIPGQHVFRASRLSPGSLWFPTQDAVLHYTPAVRRPRALDAHLARRIGAHRSEAVLLGWADPKLGRQLSGAVPRTSETGRCRDEAPHRGLPV